MALNDAFHRRADTILPLLWDSIREGIGFGQLKITAGIKTYFDEYGVKQLKEFGGKKALVMSMPSQWARRILTVLTLGGNKVSDEGAKKGAGIACPVIPSGKLCSWQRRR